MQNRILLILLGLFLLGSTARSQSLDSLELMKTYRFPVYFSTGNQASADTAASHIEAALSFFGELLNSRPSVSLLVLNEADWKKYAYPAMIYGMPHFDAKNKTLIVAANDNAFWRSFLPPPDQLPEELRDSVKTVYSGSDGQISAAPFFRLLAIHELAHSFHLQANLNMQRNWMSELFVNILLHTFIAEKKPASLPALTLLPQLVVGAGSEGMQFTSLKDVHERYTEIATQHPRNYGWYQCHWHSAAARIYEAEGRKAGQDLWKLFSVQKETLTDEELISLLEKKAGKSIADMIRNWDAMVK